MNVAQEVADQIAFEADRLESVAFVTGSGTNQPQGIVTALSGTASSVNTTTADQFGLVDLYGLDGALPARYRFRASWLAHRKIFNAVRQFDTSGGAALWVQLGADVPPQLIGKGAYEAEGMAYAAVGYEQQVPDLRGLLQLRDRRPGRDDHRVHPATVRRSQDGRPANGAGSRTSGSVPTP